MESYKPNVRHKMLINMFMAFMEQLTTALLPVSLDIAATFKTCSENDKAFVQGLALFFTVRPRTRHRHCP